MQHLSSPVTKHSPYKLVQGSFWGAFVPMYHCACYSHITAVELGFQNLSKILPTLNQGPSGLQQLLLMPQSVRLSSLLGRAAANFLLTKILTRLLWSLSCKLKEDPLKYPCIPMRRASLALQSAARLFVQGAVTVTSLCQPC